MGTLTPAAVKKASENSLEKKIYAIVEELSDYLPIPNDRNRLGYNLYKQVMNEGDSTEIIIRTNRLSVVDISKPELAKLIDEKIASVKEYL